MTINNDTVIAPARAPPQRVACNMRGRKRHLCPDAVVWTTWNSGETWWPGRVLDRPRASLPANKLLVDLFALDSFGPFLFAPNHLADYLAEHKHLRANPSAELRPAVHEADHFIRTEGTPHQRAAIALAGPTSSTSSVSPTPNAAHPDRRLPSPPPRKSSAAKPDWPNSAAATSTALRNPNAANIRVNAVPAKNVSSPSEPKKSAPSMPKMPDSRNKAMGSQKPNGPNAKDDTPNPFAVTAAMLTTPVPYAPALIDVMRQTAERGADKKQGKREVKETRATLPKSPPVIDRVIKSAHRLHAGTRPSKREAVLAKKQNGAAPGGAKAGQKTATTTTTVASKQSSSDASNVGTTPRMSETEMEKILMQLGGRARKEVRHNQTSCQPNPMGNGALAQQMRNCGLNVELQEAVTSATTTSLEPRKSSDVQKPMVAQPPKCMLKLRLRPPPPHIKHKRLPAPPPHEVNATCNAKAKTEDGNDRKRMCSEPLKKRMPQRKSVRKVWCNTDAEHEKDRGDVANGESTRTTVTTPKGSQRGSSFSETPPPAKRKRVSAPASKPSGGSNTPMWETLGGDERTRFLISQFHDIVTQVEGMVKEVMGLPMFADTGQKADGAQCEALQKRRDAVSKEVADLQTNRQSLEKEIVRVQNLVKDMCENRDRLNAQVEQARRLIREQDAAKARLSRELAEAAGSQ